ncbi:hypothetical protein QQF64_024307 [Cirrhinus molitorella]|uniref:Uncharacterized protein n=1 Tax=Cirrhinus molitorella TaxID=172907 RepID=A0ABR3NKV5_9TELE
MSCDVALTVRGIQTEVSHVCVYDPEISGGNIHILEICFNITIPQQLPSHADLTSRNLKVAKLPRTDPELSEAPGGRSGCGTELDSLAKVVHLVKLV